MLTTALMSMALSVLHWYQRQVAEPFKFNLFIQEFKVDSH